MLIKSSVQGYQPAELHPFCRHESSGTINLRLHDPVFNFFGLLFGDKDKVSVLNAEFEKKKLNSPNAILDNSSEMLLICPLAFVCGEG